MIVDSKLMKQVEADSGRSTEELMEDAGRTVAEAVMQETEDGERILILAGNGNNGGDGFVAAGYLKNRKCTVICVSGEPKTEAAMHAYSRVPKSMIRTTRSLKKAAAEADVIIDAVYGFGYHGELRPEMRRIFRMINQSSARVFSIDINSGCESDTGHYDRQAIRSEITFALDCLKPVHLLRKEHRLFKEVRVLDLGLPHPASSPFREMDEETFFANFPRKAENAYKTSFGRTLIVGGSYGMAGAVSLNILGARTVGASFIDAALDESIYPIVASRHMTTVFHPFGYHTASQVLLPLIPQAKAIAFGSGAVNMPKKSDCMDMILQNSRGPVILDAEGLRLLEHNTYILRFVKCPVIVTPHVGEFAGMLSLPIETVMDHRISLARQFAQEYGTIIVLKGANTVVVSPHGETYINQTGNQALAQAGSGDLLTGIMAAILTMTRDVFTGVCMAVWLHGYLADLGIRESSIQGFDLESFPKIMDRLFRKHGF